jgi:hypothetical protein
MSNQVNKGDFMRLLCNDQWSNASCCGYLIKACETLHYSQAETDKLLSAMEATFEQYSIEQAKNIYMKY